MTDGRSLCHDESLRFCGIARVDLDTLNFENASSEGRRETSARNVARLVNIFRIEGCKRSEAGNFVKAKVNQHQLDAALASQNLSLPQQPPEDWRAYPILKLRSVDCLNGLHRLLAARLYLNENDQWWIARLYTEGKAGPCHILGSCALTCT